ncbi:metallophosphoesterase family protein [Fundicoccus ignavus]|nr:metallophosphoesterase [Fundicoccus ignavus]
MLKKVNKLKNLKVRDQTKGLQMIAQVLSIMSLALACVCPLQSVHAQSEIEFGMDQADVVDIWLITDIHYMAPSLTDGSQRFEIFQKQAAGMDYEYGPDRMEALIKQIETAQMEGEQPQALIVAGDLTSNGEYQAMLDLAEYFGRIEALGTEVFVIPGNHDIHNGWAVRFEGKKTIKVQQTSPADFAEIFADFGYGEAVARDPESLSYLAQVTDDWQLLMLDTNIYSETKGQGQSESQGRVKEETIAWAETMVKQAKVLPIMHHGALSHFRGEVQKVQNDNELDAFQQFLVTHRIPLTLAGHLHTQHITSLQTPDFTLNEVITTSFSIYPGKIGRVQLSNNSVNYQQIDLDMRFSFEEGEYDQYMTHLADLHKNSTHLIIFDTLYNDQTLKPYTEEISEVFEALNLSFFMGSISEEWTKLEAALAEIDNYIVDTDYRFFNDYLDLILSTKDYSQTELGVGW